MGEFEEWSSDLFPLIVRPIDDALNSSRVKVGDIDAVELIGGAWRMPRVQQVLSEYLSKLRGFDAPKLALGQHLNGEEAAALGAAYSVASLGGGVGPRLRPIPVKEILSHEYSLSVQKLNSSQPGESFSTASKVIFKRGSKFPVALQKMEFKAVQSDFRFTLYEDGHAMETHRITDLYSIRKLKYANSDAPDVVIPIELDINGIVKIGNVEATFQTVVEAKPDSKSKKSSKPIQKKVKKNVRLMDDVSYERPAPMSRKHRLAAAKQFKELLQKDRAALLAAQSRNSLEAYIFDSKDKLASPEVIALLSDTDLERLKSLLDEAQTWLHENGEGASTQKLLARLNVLKREVDPALKEVKEHSIREERANLERHGTAGTESAKAKAARIARKRDAARARASASSGEL